MEQYIIRSEDGVQTFHIEDGWQGDDAHATQFSDKAKALFGALPDGGNWESVSVVPVARNPYDD